MSYSKISSLLLYVVAGISLVVMIFYYVGPKTINMTVDELDAKVTSLTTEDIMAPQADDQTLADSAAIDSLQMEADSSMTSETDSTVTAATDTDMVATARATSGEVDLRDYLSAWEIMVYKRTDYALGWAYILFIIAAIAALIFPMINIVTDVKAIIRLVAILGATAVLILISYFALASDATINILGYTGTENSNPTVLKWVGTGLFVTYFLFGIAILSILYSEVVKLFK